MRDYTKQYINGEWVESNNNETIEVINPATEESSGKLLKVIKLMLIKPSRRQTMFI